MSFWGKLTIALMGENEHESDKVMDTEALAILDEEVRDATDTLKRVKGDLSDTVKKFAVCKEKVLEFEKNILEYEGYVEQALQKENEALALDVAGKIAEMENRLNIEHDSARYFGRSVEELRVAIKQAEQNLRRLKQQVDTVKASETVFRAQAAVAFNGDGDDTRLRTAMDSLARIHQKQAEKSAQIIAAGEVAKISQDDGLKARLAAAGIAGSGSRAQDVLARIKSKVSD